MSNFNFSQSPSATVPRSSFDRSHGIKTTFDAGNLIPFFCDEVLPGDTFNLKANLFGRLATPITPIMDNMYLDTQFFYVPYRLLWNNFQKMFGEQDNPGDSTDFLAPKMTSTAASHGEQTIYDYFGLPTKIDGIEHSSAPLRAYNLIYNEWYRDQNLIDSVIVNKDDSDDDVADYQILKRCKRHDYFTSALPWAQKGDAVTLPLGTSAPVVSNEQIIYLKDATTAQQIRPKANTSNMMLVEGSRTQTNVLKFGQESGLQTDLTNATAATINSLRLAFQVQKLFERDARGGTRYTEILKSHFGVTSPDSRLQRPEYLGGSSTRINITPIPQTSETGTTPQGTLGAYGLVSSKKHGFNKSFVEHGFVIGLLSVRADLNYQQGLNKMWSRRTRFDFYVPALAHLGEQSILNKEIYAQGSSVLNPSGDPQDEDAFGFQERWAEYRYKPSQITGLFRSNATQSLDTWHLGQDFTSLPALNESFIKENPPIDRVIAVPSEPHMIIDGHISLKCTRPMPLYSVPGMIDHF